MSTDRTSTPSRIALPLRLVADDLTGALDSACAFAAPDRPVAVAAHPNSGARSAGAGLTGGTMTETLAGAAMAAGGIALSSETRHADGPVAQARTARMTAGLRRVSGPGGFWFKKIDSVLRGHPVAETVAMMRAGGFARCVFAPAFPDQGRVTIAARQHVVEADGTTRAVGPDLLAAFDALGIRAAPWSPAGRDWPEEARILIADAREPGDLARLAAEIALSHDRLLWAGSGGLAEALGRRAAMLPVPPLAVAIAGTNHPATLRQMAALAALPETCLRRIDGGAVAPPPTDAGILAVMPSEELATSEAVDDALDRSLRHLVTAMAPPSGLFVTGGETLSRLMVATGARHVLCTGRVETGIPTGHLDGGLWDGIPVVTKSGGFGRDGLLVDLVRRGRGSAEKSA